MTGRRRLLAGTALGLALLSGCGSGAGASRVAAAATTEAGSRLAGTALFVDPDSHPAQQVPLLRAAGQTADADAVQALADQPIARWFTGSQQGDPFQQAQALTTAAAARGTAAVITVYDLPGRDCGQYSSGGAPDEASYVQYVGALAAGIGDRAAVVVLEPDAVAHSMQGCGSVPRTRQLLRSAVDMLGRQPATRVYLDAGNATWIHDLPALAGALRDSGITEADGFALNVANFETTPDSAAYGRQLSDLLGGAHFVVDTSRNGAGPPTAGAAGGSAHAWCNPPGRRLGAAPTTDPGQPRVDALLWVKSPGDSDGTCSPGAAPAGTWSLELARDLTG